MLDQCWWVSWSPFPEKLSQQGGNICVFRDKLLVQIAQSEEKPQFNYDQEALQMVNAFNARFVRG